MRKNLLFLTIYALVFLLLFSSCAKSRNEGSSSEFFAQGRFEVTIKTPTGKWLGELWLDEEECLHFLHKDPDSILFGLEESTDGEKITCRYKDIAWSCGEINFFLTDLLQGMKALKSATEAKSEKEVIDGVHYEKLSFSGDQLTCALRKEKEAGWPQTMEMIYQGKEYKVTFLKKAI